MQCLIITYMFGINLVNDNTTSYELQRENLISLEAMLYGVAEYSVYCITTTLDVPFDSNPGNMLLNVKKNKQKW